jgi:hypothetical protein
MIDTLKSLAGDKFKLVDVIAALHAPLKPEELVLDRCVFLPHARTGVAAALNAPFDWKLPVRAAVGMRVPIVDDRGPLDAEMTVRVYGPADVTEIDPRQVIRTHPKADVVNAEVDDLVQVEFDRPDLPWLFTPAGPDAHGRLVPWVTLVVAERRHVEWGATRGAVRLARIRRDQLQPLHDAWAWAHAQVMGAKAPTPAAEPTLGRRLSESTASQNLSRLVCPRRLDVRTHYVACVVPAFLAGAQAGFGLVPATTLAPAWGTKNDFVGGDPNDMVALPVYYSWSFGTAEEGNFESLARKLRPAIAPPGVGRRRVDAGHAWPGLALGADAAGAEVVVTGPVVSPQGPETEPLAEWPPEAQQLWQAEVTEALARKLNRPDEQAHAADPGPPVVAPPLYGGTHARQPRIEMEDPAHAAQPPWFRELNLDPRNRIVAGLGTRVVQTEQSDLMLAAWNQVAGIEASNRALRMAQLARHVSASLHRRHLSRLNDAAVVPVTERVHPKVLDVARRSVWSSIKASSLPLSVTTGAFRRLTRVRGPLMAAAIRARAGRASAVDRLTVLDDRLTTSWVLGYQQPEGLAGIGDIAAQGIDDGLAAQIRPGADAATLLQQWRGHLARGSTSDHLTDRELQQARTPARADLAQGLLTSLADRLLGSMPSEREMQGDPDHALTGAAHSELLRAFGQTADAANQPGVPVRQVDVKRLGLPVTGRAKDPLRMMVGNDALVALGIRAVERARGHHLEVPVDTWKCLSTNCSAMPPRSVRWWRPACSWSSPRWSAHCVR